MTTAGFVWLGAPGCRMAGRLVAGPRNGAA